MKAKLSFLNLLVLITTFLGLSVQIHAYDLVDTDSTTVLAVVPDREKPTPPVLIQPEDDELLNIAMPEFIWTGSTDNVAIDFYRVWLDGSILADEIDPSSGTDNIFSFTPTHTIADGEHSWQVQAVDTNDNFAFSATWYFVIDTLSPQFIITDIDQTELEIIASENHSFSESYIVETATPILKGTGEAGSSVQIYIAISGSETSELHFTIAESSNWEIKLAELPENVLVYLSFIIKDQANNISVIERLPIKLVFPTEETPAIPPLIETILVTIRLKEKPPTETTPTPSMAITPKPTIIETFENLEQPRTVLIGVLPEPIAQLIIETENEPLGNWLVPIWIVLSIFLGVTHLAKSVSPGFRLHQLFEFFWILGWLPIKSRKGLVFDPVTNQTFPLTKLTLYQTQDEYSHKLKTWLSNQAGEYLLPVLKIGEFKLDAQNRAGLFPCLKPRPKDSSWQNYYLGEKFKLEVTQILPINQIPLTQADNQKIDKIPLLVRLASWNDRTSFLINLPICLLLTTLFPHPINLVFSALGLIVSAGRYRRRHN